MPAVVGLAAGAFVSSVVTAEVGGIVGMAIGAVAGGVVSGVINNALQPDAQVAQPSAGLEAQARGVLLNVAGNVEPIPVIYGSRRVGGPRVLTEVSGASNEYLHLVIVLGEGPVAAINTVYLDDTPSDNARFSTFVTIEKHLGADAQTASAALIAALPGKWSSTDTLSGIAYLYVKLQYNQTAFPNGLPTITADVDGRTLYDPRDAGTRFSNNPALAIRDYLTNTRYGRGIPTGSYDDTACATAANHCEERVTVATHYAVFVANPDTDRLKFLTNEISMTGDKVQVSSAGTLPAGLAAATNYYVIRYRDDEIRLATSYANALAGTYIDITTGGTGEHTLSHIDQARYTCDGVVNVDQSPLDNYRALLTACRGYPVFSGGKHKLVIDKAETPTSFAFTEDNIVGAWTIQPASKRTQVNRVKAQFFNPVLRWQPDFEIFESSTHRTADNGLVLESQIQLPFTANRYRAHQIAQLEERQSRVGIVAKFRATIAGIQCEVGDVVPITHSTPAWTAQPFRVMRIELFNSDEVDVTVRQYDVGVYSIDTPGEFVPAAATNLPNPLTIMRQLPPNVSGLEIVGAPGPNEFTGRDVKFAWRRASKTGSYEFGAEPFGGEGGLADWYFKDFKVEIYDDLTSTLLRTDYVVDPAYTYTFEHNYQDTGGTPTRYLAIKVWQRTKYDQVSTLPAMLSAQNVQSLPPTNIDLRANFKNIFLGYTPPPSPDWAGVIVWASLTPSFATTDLVAGEGYCAYVGTDPLAVIDVDAGQTWYVKYAAFDSFGMDSMTVSDALTITSDSIQTYDVASRAITSTRSDSYGVGVSYETSNHYTIGTAGWHTFIDGLYTGVSVEMEDATVADDYMFNWSIAFANGATAHTQKAVMDRIAFDSAYSADLGSLTVTQGTYAGLNCLVLTSASSFPAGVLAAGLGPAGGGSAGQGAIVTIPGQPYLFVQSVDGPNKKIYASPDSGSNYPYLVGTGTYPATQSAKFWGQATAAGVLNYGAAPFISVAANEYKVAHRTEYGNQTYVTSQLFALSCRAFPNTGAGDSISNVELIVNRLKR